jgi:CheY-like chemotaxis protein
VATVLVCDDSALVRENLHRVLASVPGITRVVDASSGEEALARWPVERPSLVLMDVRMPGIGGVEATRRLLSSSKLL